LRDGAADCKQSETESSAKRRMRKRKH
jgi:hypothetical protein